MEIANYQLLKKILLGIIISGCFLALFIPLVIVPDSYFPYIVQKTLIFRIVIEVLFCAYLVLAFFWPEYRPKKSLLLWSVLAFAGVMLITTFTSQSVIRSWWGNWERSFGTFNYLHYFAWFIVVVTVFNKKKLWSKLLAAALTVSLLISLYSLAQRFGLPFTFESGLKRVNGTIGNASFLATYLLFNLFLALLFAIEKRNWWWKIYYLFIFLVDFIVMILTGTRGALLALIASIVVFLILTVWLKIWKLRAIKVLIIASLIIFAGIGVLFAFKETSFVKNNFWFKRLTSFTLNDNTIQTRLRTSLWGLEGFRDNLLFGYGPENYQIGFNQYFQGDFYDYSRNEVWFDRAHNTLVDMASMMGIFGLLSYLSIFFVIFYYLFKLHKEQKITAPVFIVIFLLFFSYFFQNIFVFDSLSSLITFYLLLAFLFFIFQANQPVVNNQLEKTARPKRISPIITLPLAVIAFLFLLFGINIKEVKGDLNVYNAFVNGKYNNYQLAVDGYKKTYQTTVNKIDTAILLSSSLNEMIGSNYKIASKEQEINDLKLAIEWMDKAIELDPKNMFIYYLQSKNYSLLAEISLEMKYVQKGIDIAQKALQLSPNNVRPLWVLGQLYLFAGQPDTAIKYLDQAVGLNKNLPETYFYRAVVYRSQNNLDKMYEQYDALIDTQYQFISVDQVNEVLQHYMDKNDVNRTIYLLWQIAYLDPSDPNSWNSLVNFQEANKLYDDALETLKTWAGYLPSSSATTYERYQAILKEKNDQNTQK